MFANSKLCQVLSQRDAALTGSAENFCQRASENRVLVIAELLQ
jgi:hypothetical protein